MQKYAEQNLFHTVFKLALTTSNNRNSTETIESSNYAM